eukprot:EG_transcript_13577
MRPPRVTRAQPLAPPLSRPGSTPPAAWQDRRHWRLQRIGGAPHAPAVGPSAAAASNSIPRLLFLAVGALCGSFWAALRKRRFVPFQALTQSNHFLSALGVQLPDVPKGVTVGRLVPLCAAALRPLYGEMAPVCGRQLVAHSLGVSVEDLKSPTVRLRPAAESELAAFQRHLQVVLEGTPIDYVLQYVDFYGCRLTVGPAVLIPRPETEVMLDMAVEAARKQFANRLCGGQRQVVVWDICCGSGCLGIAFKKALPDNTQVILSDISPEALAVARGNATRNGVAVEARRGDLLAPFPAGEAADVVLCNPPYISAAEFAALDPSVRDHEPTAALLAGPTGTEFYERLAEELPERLSPGGLAFIEIGYRQGPTVLRMFQQNTWTQCSLGKDFAGHDRYIILQK